MSSWIDLGAVARVCAVALLAGAGLPAVFALGLRAAAPAGAGAGALPGPRARGDRPLRRAAGLAVAGICFVLTLVCAASGIALLVRG